MLLRSGNGLPEATSLTRPIAQYAPAATSLFDNMKTPASILAAGMISLGFVAEFPTLHGKRENPPEFSPAVHERWQTLKRIHIVISLISFCSELLAVMWATVAVNKLTETAIAPAYSVWDVLQRDCDLFWAATNSHFVLGMIGFMGMVGIRGYIMLLAEEASAPLMAAAISGMGAAFCLLISVVNRGVQSGGGDGVGYGDTIFALFEHYCTLLFQQATRFGSEGPLEISAIVLELLSVAFAMTVIVTGRDQHKPSAEDEEIMFTAIGEYKSSAEEGEEVMFTAATGTAVGEMEEETDDEMFQSTFRVETSISTVPENVYIGGKHSVE